MTYLLDTCAISELVAREPNRGLFHWVAGIDEVRLYLCAVSVGEIYKGIQKLATSRRRQSLAEWLQGDLLVRFRGRILPIDTGHVHDFIRYRHNALLFMPGDPFVWRRAMETAWHWDKPDKTPLNYRDGSAFRDEKDMLEWLWGIRPAKAPFARAVFFNGLA